MAVSLQKYQAKRRFAETPEPRGQKQPSRGALRFVVQKHAARRLHYDLRLELDGTLKSWAVPKGPSLDPDDKRLAILVEDHPLDYRSFEGTIPAGNYGAGTVMVWDQGTYHARQTTDRTEGGELLRQGLEKGHLTFVLNGEKLRGEFALLRLKRGDAKDWLLIKKRDQFASTSDVRDQDRSVLTGRSMEEITEGLPSTNSRTGRKAVRLDLSDAPKAKMPHYISPMLATAVDQAFDRKGWLFEVKWDGYRAIAEVEQDRVRLYSRRLLSFEKRYPSVVRSLERLGHEAVLDGEIVVVDAAGKPDFQLLQNYLKNGEGQLVYYVFDLLYLDGHDLRNLPLVRRKELLRKILPELPSVKFSDHVEEHGVAFFEAVAGQGLEGILAKEGASRYRAALRSHSWLKLKIGSRQEAVIGGFTQPKGGRKNLGALVLGVYEGDDLVYVGHAGGGFTEASLEHVRAQLDPLIQDACPFKKKPKTNAPVRWVRPELVCEVAFQKWTQDGNLRQPIFLGLRPDKPARSVHREQAEPAQELLDPPASRNLPMANKRPSKSAGEVVIDGTVVRLTNQDKVYWPKEGYTKGDLVRYYREVAPVILPYLEDRPESLHRHPNGIDGKSFFQKDMGDQPPDWVKMVKVRSDSENKEINYVVCQDEATLTYMANLGCIELNPWSSRIGSLDKPDYLVIDLDPEDVPFPTVVEAALMVRKVLEKAGAVGYCKTSGKRGLHIYVPLGARYGYDQARQFAEIIAKLVNAKLPATTSVIRPPALRRQRVYLDFLQNRQGQTLAAPYSVRPVVGAKVAAPLKWSEVRSDLDPAKFTITTMAKRLDKVGDLWNPVLGPGIDLQACLERLRSKQ